MASKVRIIGKVISGELEKHKSTTLNNALLAISSVTGKAQKTLNDVQTRAVNKCSVTVKQINDQLTVIQDKNNKSLEETTVVLPQAIIKWWQWYQKLTGLDIVEISRQQVNIAQETLFKCQDNRRHLHQEAAILNAKLKDIYGELLQIKRDDPKYVQLTIVENKTLQDLGKLATQLDLLEKEERERFTVLATAIKEYHDSQALNAQKYKYISILASACVAILSLTGSMLYNSKRIASMKDAIDAAQRQNNIALTNGFTTILEKLGKEKQSAKADTKEYSPGLLEQICNVIGANKTYVTLGIGIVTLLCFGIYM